MRVPAAFRFATLLLCLFLSAGCGDDDPGGPDGNGGVENEPPVIATLTVDPPILRPGERAVLECEATDADGDSLVYAWAGDAGTYPDSLNSGDRVRWVDQGAEGTVELWVTVSDGKGGSDSDTVSVDVIDGTLILQTRDGVTAMDFRGDGFVLNDATSPVEVLGTRIFYKGGSSITEIDHQGNTVATTAISGGDVSGHDWMIHPDGGFTFVSNSRDSIYSMGPDGVLLAAQAMPDSSPDELQNIDGVVVDGHLYISETGENQLIDLDLTTLTATIFREIDPGGGWLGAIDYGNGAFSLGRSQKIHRFTAAGEVTDLCTLPEGNITGLATAGSYLFATVNHTGELYRIHSVTGEYAVLNDSLNYPQDVEFLPAVLDTGAVAP